MNGDGPRILWFIVMGCNVAVHQACYGIVQVPTGPWFCRKCESQERQARVRCELCPSKDGALKRTDNGGWAHVVCSLYIPEVRFGNVSTMEPIVLALVPPERYHKTCYICEEQGKESKASVGACMQCNKPGCKHNFHVTCAQAAGLLCEEAGNFNDNVKYCGYCAHHYQKLKKDGSNIKPIPAFKPIPVTESTPESSPEKKTSGPGMGTSSIKPTSPSEMSKSVKKKVTKSHGFNPSTSIATGSAHHISNLKSNNPGSSNNSLGSRPNDHGSDTKSKIERKKKKSNSYAISSASHSPAGQSNSSNDPGPQPHPPHHHHHKKDLDSTDSSSSSSSSSSPNPTPSFTAMYGSLTAKDLSSTTTSSTAVTATTSATSSTTNDRREKSKREIEDDSSTETEEESNPGKPPIPKKMKNMTAAEKKAKKPLVTPKCNKTPKLAQKDSSSSKKTKRKKEDLVKETSRDVGPEKSSSAPKAKPSTIKETQSSSKLTPPTSDEISPANETSSSATTNGHASQSIALTRSPSTTVNKDFALPAPPSKPRSTMLKEPLPDGPQTLEQLLERQWAAGAQMIMDTAQHFDVASLLSCLHQLRSENERLEEKVRQLSARRDHLLAVNSRLSHPLNGSLNPPITPLGGLANHSSTISQNGSANSVPSSPLSFPSSNSGANPSPLYDPNNKSPRTSPASSVPNGSTTATNRAANHLASNGETSANCLPPSYHTNAQPQFNISDTQSESPFYQMMNAAPQQNTPNFQQPFFRGPEKRC